VKTLMTAAVALLTGCASTQTRSASINVNHLQPNILYLTKDFRMTTGSMPTPGAPSSYRYGPIHTP